MKSIDLLRNQAHAYDRRWARYLDGTLGPAIEALGLASGRVVDLGSGTGELARRLRAVGFGGEVVGVEPSPSMLAVAAGKRVAKLDLIRGSADRVPLADGTADACVSASALHAMDRPHALFAETRRLLRPGGRLILVDWSAEYVSVRLRAAYLRRFDPGFRRAFRPDAACKMVVDNGLQVVEVRSWRVGWTWGAYRVVALKPHPTAIGLASAEA